MSVSDDDLWVSRKQYRRQNIIAQYVVMIDGVAVDLFTDTSQEDVSPWDGR
jgi:hypothetical protein